MSKKVIKKKAIKKRGLDMKAILKLAEEPERQKFDPYEGLNNQQKEVVAFNDGKLVVPACAGAGKTETMIRRMVRMFNDGADPDKFLATTFTKKAANELNDRLKKMGAPSGARVGTFHSVCLEIIRDGSPWKDFEVDAKDKMRLVTKEITGWKGMKWDGVDLTDVLKFISDCKNNMVEPENSKQTAWKGKRDPRYSEAYFRYEEEREIRGLITFDDMLWLAVKWLREDGDARVRWSGRYEHVVIDEYQDSNLAQNELMKILSENAKSLVTTGDDCQAIYEWRQARPEYIIGFEKQYAAKAINLGINYRSHPEIVERAEKLISNNENRIKKLVTPNRMDNGKAVTFSRVGDTDDEAGYVLDRIRELKESGRRYGDHTVLYRTNAQSRAFEEIFIKEKIPYVVIGGTDFWKRKEIVDILGYLKIAVNEWDNKACMRAVNRPFRYIGRVTLDKIDEVAENTWKSCFNVITRAREYNLDIRDRQYHSLSEFVGIVRDVQQDIKDELPLSSVFSNLLKNTKYEQWLAREEGTDTVENSRVANLRELVRTSDRFKTAGEFLDYLAGMERAKNKRKRKDKNAEAYVHPDLVQLMSIHKSKGLEFPVVFVAGMSEKILPHGRSGNMPEERRLAYVAMTRARDVLYLTSPEVVALGANKVVLEVSRFVREAGFQLETPIGDSPISLTDCPRYRVIKSGN